VTTSNGVLYRVDKALGDGLEWAVRAHHHRRLRKLGWQHAFEPAGGLWASGRPPPQEGNGFEVLIDGAAAFPRIVEELERATSHVFLAGWYFTPEFEIVRDGTNATLRDLIARLSERVDVRVLLWAGIPVPLNLVTSRKDIRDHVAKLRSRTGASIAIDSRERPMHCHHEKLVIVDDRVGFVGGIEPTDLEGDRYDSSEHPPRSGVGWHDATVRLEGPIVADVTAHFRMRWQEVSREPLPPPVGSPTRAGSTTVQLVRTVPEKIYDALPKGDFRILEAYRRALVGAREFVYLENQFLWSPSIIDVLKDKLISPPTDDFRVVVVLPSKPTTGADNTLGQLGVLLEADPTGDRFLACSLYSHSNHRTERIYVHAKIGIVDDKWLTVGSANLNSHSLFNDTEVNVVTCDEDIVRATRHRLWAEHLEVPIDHVQGPPGVIIDELWHPIAREQLRRRKAGQPPTHRLSLLPHASKRSKRLLGPVQSLFVDG
jgi:phosphatidylserine/phosphatidylglycerophosphate/cardiolipin synthase-like enzyme